jgi:AcrR family transcriptional regulator
MGRPAIIDADRRILDATFKVAAHSPQGSLSTKEIAREAGLSEGAIFAHFANKRSLINRCLQDSNRRVFEADVEASKVHDGDFYGFYSAVLDWYIANPNEARFAMKYSLMFPRTGRDDEYEFFINYVDETWGSIYPMMPFKDGTMSKERWVTIALYCVREVIYDSLYIISGRVPDTPAVRRSMTDTLLRGLSVYMKS